MKKTMNDVVIGKTAGFFAQPGEEVTGKKIDLEAAKKQYANVDRKKIELNVYNISMCNLDPMYSELSPASPILIRLYVHDNLISDSGLFTGVRKKKVEVAAMQRGGYIKNVVEDPFAFNRKCMIIAVPEGEEKFKVGDVYACGELRTVAPQAGDGSVFDYNFSFTHPDAQLAFPPTDVKNRHFGYAMVRRDLLLAKVDNYLVKHEYRPIKPLIEKACDEAFEKTKEDSQSDQEGVEKSRT